MWNYDTPVFVAFLSPMSLSIVPLLERRTGGSVFKTVVFYTKKLFRASHICYESVQQNVQEICARRSLTLHNKQLFDMIGSQKLSLQLANRSKRNMTIR